MATKKTSKKTKKINFHEQLILNKWLWSKFNPQTLEKMQAMLDMPEHEGIETEYDNAGQTKFFTELTRDLTGKHSISDDCLRRYDSNIVKHWKQITDKRNEVENKILNLKYFQYLSLLFSEYYLDQYFHHSDSMLAELNQLVDDYNGINNDVNNGDLLATLDAKLRNENEQLQHYDNDDLNKIAFWNATGSGKTLLMHVNILQYQHYIEQSSIEQNKIEQIILLTPNEGLSNQHLQEFAQSDIKATLFDKNKSRNSFLNYIQIIDINKLAERDGDKTVAVESLEGNNLVLIDEGHRGASNAGVWMNYRDTITKGGFSFEYSATFGQAVSKSNNVIKEMEESQKSKAKMLFGTRSLRGLTKENLQLLELNEIEQQIAKRNALREVYAKCILFDYSYKYFYNDGYGKEVNILNMKDTSIDEEQNLYLTACLLSFYQQQYLYANNQHKLTQFNIENPLWVFVGNKVNDDNSDILTIIKFLADFLDSKKKATNIEWLHDFITNKPRLLDNQGNNIFSNRFQPLLGKKAEDVYQDIVAKFFNASSNQRLNVIRITANKGELRLQVGENEAFGVISVGDESNLFKSCAEIENDYFLNARTDDFKASMFAQINDEDSKTNLLIGSRKFTEGWSSWRVSTMGLLNMGRGEGSQIIQLFGRGVRLKGQDFSLKRTPNAIYNLAEYRDLYLDLLQTLNIFGLKADYMEQFRNYLSDEGITLSQDLLTLDFKTNRIQPKQAHKLKTLVLKDGYKDNQANGFKAQVKLSLFTIPSAYKDKIKKPFVTLDLYPRLQAFHTDSNKRNDKLQDKRQEHEISPSVMAFFDFDRLYLQLQQHKMHKGYSNIQLDIQQLKEFCLRPIKNTRDDWYKLLVDSEKLSNSVQGIHYQQEILLELLQNYMDKFYKTMKNAYEGQFYEVQEFEIADDALPVEMLKQYQFTAKEGQNNDFQDYVEHLEELQNLVNKGKLNDIVDWQVGSLRTVVFDSHLYYPLFSKNDDQLPFTWTPMVFDYTAKGESSEVTFVDDLQKYLNSDKKIKELADYHVYLLRNPANKYKGLGFALAGNFYPDFLMWLVNKKNPDKQYLTLIDPKGIRNLSVDDAKINLYQEIKNVEKELESDLILNSFILTTTAMKDMINLKFTQQNLKDRHILFMGGNQTDYLSEMFKKIIHI